MGENNEFYVHCIDVTIGKRKELLDHMQEGGKITNATCEERLLRRYL